MHLNMRARSFNYRDRPVQFEVAAMSFPNRLPKWLFFVVFSIAAAGCSSLPGLQVLTGQEVAQSEISDVVEQSDLVMADKTGSTDPSLIRTLQRLRT